MSCLSPAFGSRLCDVLAFRARPALGDPLRGLPASTINANVGQRASAGRSCGRSTERQQLHVARTVRGGAWRGLLRRRSEAATAVKVRRRLEPPQSPDDGSAGETHAAEERERGERERERERRWLCAPCAGDSAVCSPASSLSVCVSLHHSPTHCRTPLPLYHSISPSPPRLALSQPLANGPHLCCRRRPIHGTPALSNGLPTLDSTHYCRSV